MRFTPSVPRRTKGPPLGFGGGGPAREIAEVRAGVEGAVAVQQGKDRRRSRSTTRRRLLRDFSSGKHGDIFGFVMETEGVSFPEAVERLGGMAGLPMPKSSQATRKRARVRARRCPATWRSPPGFFTARRSQPRGRRRGARLVAAAASIRGHNCASAWVMRPASLRI